MNDLTQELQTEKTLTSTEQQLKTLQMKYEELGRAYDAMQNDLMFLLAENRRLKEELGKRKQ